MGTTTLPNRYEINGIIDTNNSVLDNLTTLCNASGCWLTYDNYAGAWSVIINRSGASVYSFDDSNIVGAISISGTGLYNLYNSVRVSFPHEDLRNQKSYVQIDIPAEDRYPNEPDNVLQIDYPIVTNPVQAQLLGFIELKQSRVDKIITFNTDYSVLGVKAGDVIDVTNSIYNFNNKLFRVITVKESDGTDNNIELEITALEYSSDVYDESTLNRYTVTNENGIVAIGAIPAPTTPTVTAYELVSNPRVSATTTVNGGIVDQVEFWYTTDVPPAVNDDTSRTYTLLGTVNPENTTLFSDGENVTLEIPSLNAGEFLIKARCKNSSAVSPFSNPSGILTYNAKQATDVIGPDTQQVDENGDVIGTLGLSAMLALANEFFSGNAAVGPGGGSGSGSTFLFLNIQNFNSNATTGGPYPGTGSAFMPIVRIIPPPGYRTRLTENLDQTYLNQCMVGRYQSSGGSPASASYAFIQHAFWPQYYKHRILGYFPLSDSTENVAGGSATLYAVDLNAFQYYYPDATECRVEVRGYWRLLDQVQPQITTSSPTHTFVNSDFQPSVTGTAPIRVKADVYTGANVAPGGNPVAFDTLGIGVSANVVVTNSVYAEAVGANVALTSKGQHITTFVYDFTKPAYQAPRFDNFGSTNPVMPDTMPVPVAWTMDFDEDLISNVRPTANVTVDSIIRRRGNNQITTSTTPQSGGTYFHAGLKDTNSFGPIPPPIFVNVPMTANLQYVDYSDPPEGYDEELLPYTDFLDSLYLDSLDANLQITLDMFRIQNTGSAFVEGANPNLNGVDLPNAFVPTKWAQLRANVSASHGISSLDYWPNTTAGANGVGAIDGANPNITVTQLGYFTANADLGSQTVNHLVLTNTTNANANVTSSLGGWIRTTS